MKNYTRDLMHGQGRKSLLNRASKGTIEAPCNKLQGIFDPQGRTFILIAR
jgi:hypothetical protein